MMAFKATFVNATDPLMQLVMSIWRHLGFIQPKKKKKKGQKEKQKKYIYTFLYINLKTLYK